MMEWEVVPRDRYMKSLIPTGAKSTFDKIELLISEHCSLQYLSFNTNIYLILGAIMKKVHLLISLFQ